MSNRIYTRVAYGLVLANDDGFTEQLAGFDTDTMSWHDGLLKNLYPEGSPCELSGDEHHIKGCEQPMYRWCNIPLIIIGEPWSAIGQTDNRDNPTDLTGLLEILAANKPHWDDLFADFVHRCAEAGVKIHETQPHLILYLTWD